MLAGRPGWGVDEIEAALAGAPALAGRVVRPGYVDDATRTALLRGAAVVAYPSLEEGFGLPVLEALAVGAAVVTTTGSAMEEVAGDAALLVPPGDEAALAGALEAVLAGGPEVDRLRAAGPRTAAPYTWEASAAGHVKAYLEAAGIVITVLCGGVGAARVPPGPDPGGRPGRRHRRRQHRRRPHAARPAHLPRPRHRHLHRWPTASTPSAGWGLAGETWAAMDALDRYGGATWFRLGDRDLATHLYRTGRLREGAGLAEVTAEVAAGVGRRRAPAAR